MTQPLIDKVKLLDKLELDYRPIWGQMTPQHMIEHLILTMRISSGQIKAECLNPPEKLPTLKKFLLSSRPLPKNYSLPRQSEGLFPLHYSGLSEAKNILIDEINLYYKYRDENPDAALVNPTFGILNKSEWETFHEKHFKHHFEQFDLLK